jgi:hypothetical protein
MASLATLLTGALCGTLATLIAIVLRRDARAATRRRCDAPTPDPVTGPPPPSTAVDGLGPYRTPWRPVLGPRPITRTHIVDRTVVRGCPRCGAEGER